MKSVFQSLVFFVGNESKVSVHPRKHPRRNYSMVNKDLRATLGGLLIYSLLSKFPHSPVGTQIFCPTPSLPKSEIENWNNYPKNPVRIWGGCPKDGRGRPARGRSNRGAGRAYTPFSNISTTPSINFLIAAFFNNPMVSATRLAFAVNNFPGLA